MSGGVKKALRAAGIAAAILLAGGIPLFFLFLLASLGLAPLYVTKVIPVAGIALLLALTLSASGYLPPRWVKRVWLAFFCVVLGSGAYMAHGAWRDSIPTMDDRELLLWEYEPFSENTKAVTLDEPSELTFDWWSANHLRLDGATALYPVYAGFVQAVYPKGQYSRYTTYGDTGTVACSGTIEAYERLIRRETDIIFAAAPSEAQLASAEQAGMELHLTPIGREAFVFFVNSKNPVENLTVEQIQGIYSGEITNWKQVGGQNRSIRPFQRAENSGSQSALLRLMDGLPLLEPEEEDRIAGMGGIIRQVASYRNYQNAIGFSFRYYVTEMVQNGDIRLLALDGVAPTRETIRDGSYPISSEFYAVTAAPIGQPAPRETNTDIAAFLDWMVSDQGQAIVEKTGYVALA